MKEILDKESKKALVAYRIQRAYETLREAEVMIRESFYNAAINRLYYACYYATVALLLKYDIQTQTHNGVKTMQAVSCRRNDTHPSFFPAKRICGNRFKPALHVFRYTCREL